ncbi:hypothetical protein [Pontibacter sp. G13]|uniref:hypothetical protein n=1 Tax=Pontibacter sp. G13 TaxID=3074898 RepID=UPI00288A4A1D|nr:hypothetical protein [Pontibacter sp. G13]WNJ19248.1 hypothetical protein RJD25_02050 [Pontibacter sp. G13]
MKRPKRISGIGYELYEEIKRRQVLSRTFLFQEIQELKLIQTRGELEHFFLRHGFKTVNVWASIPDIIRAVRIERLDQANPQPKQEHRVDFVRFVMNSLGFIGKQEQPVFGADPKPEPTKKSRHLTFGRQMPDKQVRLY